MYWLINHLTITSCCCKNVYFKACCIIFVSSAPFLPRYFVKRNCQKHSYFVRSICILSEVFKIAFLRIPFLWNTSSACFCLVHIYIAQKMKFSIKDFFIKCNQMRRKLWIWSHLLKKSLMENFIFRAVIIDSDWCYGQFNLP